VRLLQRFLKSGRELSAMPLRRVILFYFRTYNAILNTRRWIIEKSLVDWDFVVIPVSR
jgi:hypothetical protein